MTAEPLSTRLRATPSLKRADADKPLRIPVELDEAKLPGAPQ